MKKLLCLLFSIVTITLSAGDKSRFSYVYDLDFEMLFDNREFSASSFTPSMTIFGARLTPSVGLTMSEYNGAHHRLMVGIDVMKDFGASPVSELIAGGQTDETSAGLNNTALFRELTLYYGFNKRFSNTSMEIYAGIFPRKIMEGEYSPAMMSDSLKFYDNNLEGLLLKFRRPHAYFEIGCDWMGQYGTARREKFIIFTSGGGRVLQFMSLGYSGYMLHYANSTQAKGLVDNFLLNPYARFDFGDMAGMQCLSFRLGWLQAIQRDRIYVGRFITPFGGEFDQEIRNWNVGIHNRMYYGHNLMPYYDGVDNAGVKYGPNVYLGDPFWRVHSDGNAGTGLYDRLEVYYEPRLGDILSLRVAALFHFHGFIYSGCQQVVSLRFNLHGISRRKRF